MISVCMATHNGARYIKEQLDSILMQLNSGDEIIISDDHSSDETISIIESYHDRRIKILKQAARIGVARNFEASLSQSKGDIIFLADQDDVWAVSKIEIVTRYLQHHDLIVSDCAIVDQGLNTKFDSFYSIHGSRKGFLKNLVKNSYMGCCMAFNRKLLKKALPFPADIPMHDQWLGMIGELHFRVRFINEVLVHHRKHEKNGSSTARESHLSLSKKLTHRYQVLKNIMFHKSNAA
jgi:glycosyltransferase involved in cell wall biosynthesis